MMTSMSIFLLCFACQMLVYFIPTVALSLSSDTDKVALLALKEKLTDGLLDSLPSWNESLHFCEWQGVTCGRRHMRVSALHLENQTLGGTLGPSLGNLTFLRILQLRNVFLHGKIPSQVGHLKRLQILDLNNNNLDGEVPMELANCTSIKTIILFKNRLIGRIPTWFESMMQLTELNLGANNLVGTIPSSLGNVSSLQKLYLADQNHLNGGIPYSLDLSFNNLYGEVPKGGVFSNVTAISLTGNKNLCGGIPQLKLPVCFRAHSKKHKRSLKKKLIVISVIGGILISFIALTFVHFLTRKPKRLPYSTSLQNGNMRVTYGELHEATNGFSSSNLIGTGSFGSVYKGSLSYFERLVAVKVLNLEARGAAKSFMAECNALGKMKHRNLVKILTCCSSIDYNGEDFKAIVFEFMPNGSLEMMLHNIEGSENHNLNFKQRIDIALDVAHAVDYLHNDTEQPVVHCDIKPSNVLIDDDIVAHLGDFGLARLIHGVTGHSNNDQVISSTIKG
ncbi:LRR receptor-like kinase resistance protein, partial [Trifolium pratense]